MTAVANSYPPPLSIGQPLVSIIVPCYNAAPYLEACIRSVLHQSWSHWEMLFVDNGSSDGSQAVVAAFNDSRIRLLHEPRRGVSQARNLALETMQGDFFCFLDADDILPPDSIRLRLDLFRRYPDAQFADGAMEAFITNTGKIRWKRSPWLNGMPFDALMRLDGSCFAGNTWMIRRAHGTTYRFPIHMHHSEEHAFYLSISRQGRYVSTPRVVLRYRTGHPSANSNPFSGHGGYLALYQWMRNLDPAPSERQLKHAWLWLRKIMTRDHLKKGNLVAALRTWLQIAP